MVGLAGNHIGNSNQFFGEAIVLQLNNGRTRGRWDGATVISDERCVMRVKSAVHQVIYSINANRGIGSGDEGNILRPRDAWTRNEKTEYIIKC